MSRPPCHAHTGEPGWGVPGQGGLQAHTCQGSSRPSQTLSGGSLQNAFHAQDAYCPLFTTPRRGVQTQVGCDVSQGWVTVRQTPPPPSRIGYCCGRYKHPTWNAFLLFVATAGFARPLRRLYGCNSWLSLSLEEK